MATLCLDSSLETLRPLCYRGTHLLHWELCRCFHDGFLQTVQVDVTLLVSHVLQNSPQYLVPGFEVWTPRGLNFGADKGWNVPPQPLLSRLGFWAGTESCWKTHSWPLNRVMLSCFTTPLARPLDTLGHPFSHLSLKNEDLSPPDGTPPTKPRHMKSDGIPARSECTWREVWALILLFWL